MNNMPEVKVGIVAVSRDCFPESLSVNRRKALVDAYTKKYDAKDIYECPVCIVESEIHMVQALEDIKKAGCNALCVYLGNFGPEISETLLAKHFEGPKMFIAAAEETQDNLCQGRGDAYCGMLNASYNLQLRNVKAYIPEYPVGDAEDCADMIHDFLPIARAIEGLSNLKIISFGPRPTNFLACNAPIKQLYNLGVEIEENSELDLFEAFNNHAGDERIPEIVKEMEEELGAGNKKPEILPKLAQYELTLKDWVRDHKGYRKYVTLTGKCWPHIYTLFLVVLGWGLFTCNAPGAPLGLLLSRLFIPQGGVSALYFLRNYAVLLVVCCVCSTQLPGRFWQWCKGKAPLRAALCGVCFVLCTAYVVAATGSTALYANF